MKFELITNLKTAKQIGLTIPPNVLRGSQDRKGMSAVVLGSETVKVLTHSKILTLVCR